MIKEAIDEFVNNLNSLSKDKIEQINIDLPIGMCYQLFSEIGAKFYQDIQYEGAHLPMFFNIMGTEVIVHSKESKEMMIQTKLKEIYKQLTQ